MALEPDHSLDHFLSSMVICKSVILGDPFLQIGIIILGHLVIRGLLIAFIKFLRMFLEHSSI